jgi:hypothetical protein
LSTTLRTLNHSTRNGPTPEQKAAIKEHLSEFHQKMLSQNAQIVYITVLHLLKDRKQTSIWLDDAQISRRARVLIQHIAPVQIEIARAGLLHLEPGLNAVKYELVTEDEAA